MPADTRSDEPWLGVIGRALVFMCLQRAEMVDKPLVDQAAFVQRLGISRADAAQLLGTSEDSLRVLAARAAKRRSRKGEK